LSAEKICCTVLFMKQTLFGCQADDLTMPAVIAKVKNHIKNKQPLSHVCLNVDSVIRANKDKKYLEIVNRADLVTLDGMPLVFISRLLHIGVNQRVQGSDLFDQLLAAANEEGWRVYFLGSKENVLRDVLKKVSGQYPHIKICGSHSGYWDKNQEKLIIGQIAAAKSDLVFVALGAPRQDKFVVDNLKNLKAGFAIGVGGCFEIFAGYKKRAPDFIQNLGFQWLYRFFQEPRRLFRRYFIDDLYIFPLLLKEIIRHKLLRGHSRSIRIKKNVAWSLFLQAAGTILSFLIVPITLKYLGENNYGIILTLTSLVGWLALFDVGFTQGLRNNLAEALSHKQLKLGRSYVSTTYVSLAIIFGVVSIIFFLANHFINWATILGLPAALSGEIRLLAYFIFIASFAQFVLSIINTVFNADQKPAFGGLISFICALFSALIILILYKTSPGNFPRYVLATSIAPVVVYLTASIATYRKMYQRLAPSIRLAKIEHVKKILGLGSQFFIINLAMIVVFQTDYLIILHLFGAPQVVVYNITYKYFGLTTIIFSLFVTPFWSATTEAYAKKDFAWIAQAARRLKKIFLIFFVLGAVMLAISPWFYKFWLHKSITIPFGLSLAMFIYSQLLNWGSIYVVFINGAGKIKTQFFTSIIGAIVNIPLCLILSKTLHLGPAGIIIATTICILYGYAIAPFQLRKLLQGKLQPK